ncbi:hypothetical protein [Alkalimarinus alittae]|uniref:Copper resistance protein D domain-containing protein n=1 Tax=Alkalimarinus alittae TaxID=2961619 RepID=A0ABY6N6B5_9ALTE|nr:hypothetical protein [Alkalimarinus alittae]UZE97662.1 hypothetical protein NKI27_07985 [Alkalimarinus alittae]
MEGLIVARVLHVLSVVFWIGGVAMVTTILLPSVRRFKTVEERVAFFEQVEGRFAIQSRITTVLAGLSGFYLVHSLGVWSRFGQLEYWWMTMMVVVWLIFTLMLFVLEPLFLHTLFIRRAKLQPEKTFTTIQNMHWLLLLISLVTVAGAVAGSHGWV